MDHLARDCPRCHSAGSIEFGLCQVCLLEQPASNVIVLAESDASVAASLIG